MLSWLWTLKLKKMDRYTYSKHYRITIIWKWKKTTIYYICSPWLWVKVVRWPLLAVAEYNSTLVRVIGSWLHVTLLVSNQVVVEGYATVGRELLAAKLYSIDHILPSFTWEMLAGKVSTQWPGNLLLNITPKLTCSSLTRGSYHMMLWTKLYQIFFPSLIAHTS